MRPLTLDARVSLLCRLRLGLCRLRGLLRCLLARLESLLRHGFHVLQERGPLVRVLNVAGRVFLRLGKQRFGLRRLVALLALRVIGNRFLRLERICFRFVARAVMKNCF